MFPFMFQPQHSSLLDIVEAGAAGEDFTTDDRQNLGKLVKDIQPSVLERMVGQSTAVESFLAPLKMASTATSMYRTNGPLGVFLFHGQSGLGKSFLPELLTQRMGSSMIEIRSKGGIVLPESGDESGEVRDRVAYRLVKIDCAALSEAGSLIGSPVTQMWSQFVDVIRHPNVIILFNNYTPGNRDAYEALQPILADGKLPTRDGVGIPLNRAIVVVEHSALVGDTGPIGFSKKRPGGSSARVEQVSRELSKLSRDLRSVEFLSLDRDQERELVRVFVEQEIHAALKKQYGEFQFSIGDDAIAFIAEQAAISNLGGANLANTIRINLAEPLSSKLFSTVAFDGSSNFSDIKISKPKSFAALKIVVK